jgi:hypothetical protein
MADDTQKIKWIEKLVGAVDAKIADDAKAEKRKVLLDKMRGELAPNKEQIKSGLTFQMIEKEKGSRDKILTSQGVGWEDQIETEDVSKYQWAAKNGETHAQAGSDDVVQANRAWDLVTEMKERLKGAKFPDPPVDGEPQEDLFSDQDIADEFFEPLNREGIIPENLIPKDYSNVQKMQQDTRNLYADWVKEQQAAGNKGNTIGSQGIVSGVAGIGKSVAGIFGDYGEIAQAAITCIELTVNTGIAVHDGLKQSDYETIGDAVMGNVAKCVQAALTPVNKDIAEAVGSILEGGAGIGSFAIVMATRDPLEREDLIEALGKLGSGFSSVGDGISGLLGDGGAKDGVDYGSTALNTLLGNLTIYDGVYQAIKDRKKGAIIKQLAGALNTVGGQMASEIAKDVASNMDQDKLNALKEQGTDPESIAGYVTNMSDTLNESIGDIIEAASPEESAKLSECVMKVIDGLSTSIKTTLGSIVPELADGAVAVFQSRLSPDRVGGAFQNGQFQVGIALIGLALENAVMAIIPAPVTPALKKVATSIRAKFLATAKPDPLKKMSAEGDWEGLVKALTDAGDTATGVLKGFATDPDLKDDPEMAGGMEEFTKRGNDPAKAKETNEKLILQQEQEQLDKIEKAKNEFADELNALQESDRSRRQALSLGEGGQEAIKDKAIANLIMKIQVKRAVIEAAAKLANGGMAVAAQFVTGVGIGIAALKFVQEVTEAASQALELNKWLKSADLAIKSGSMYEPAIQNFIGNREAQISHASIKAALAFTQMVLRSIETGLAASGIAAAGVVVTKILDAASVAAVEAEDLIYEVVEKDKVETAWKMTRASILNPNNRKLAKKAMKANHTWAKYAIAYGAFVKSDPIAVSAVNSIGLSQASLQHKDTDVHKVRAYLEVVYNKDKQVLKESPLVADWLPSKIELKSKCLAAAQRRGAKLADPKLPPAPPEYSKALLCLTRCDEFFSVYAKHKTKVESKTGTVEEWTTIVTTFDEYKTVLMRTEEALNYLPKDAEGRPHTGMALFLKDLGDRAGVRKEMVSALLDQARELLELTKNPPPLKEEDKTETTDELEEEEETQTPSTTGKPKSKESKKKSSSSSKGKSTQKNK